MPQLTTNNLRRDKKSWEECKEKNMILSGEQKEIKKVNNVGVGDIQKQRQKKSKENIPVNMDFQTHLKISLALL